MQWEPARGEDPESRSPVAARSACEGSSWGARALSSSTRAGSQLFCTLLAWPHYTESVLELKICSFTAVFCKHRSHGTGITLTQIALIIPLTSRRNTKKNTLLEESGDGNIYLLQTL